MSQPAASAFAPPPFELVHDDGEPLETHWHAQQLPLLYEQIYQVMVEQGRTDFHAATNNFVYYSVQQAWEVAQEVEKGGKQHAFRGPDVYWVGGVEPRDRQVWIAWEEGGRLPDVIVELLSPSTAVNDRTEKRDLYARVFRTAEYFLYDPDTKKLEGLRLAGKAYRPIPPDGQGRFWSEQLQAFFGVWRGTFVRTTADWIRLFRPDGTLVPTAEERARTAEAELVRLRALLASRTD